MDVLALDRLLDRRCIDQVLQGVAGLAPAAGLSLAVQDPAGRTLAGAEIGTSQVAARCEIVVGSKLAGWAVAADPAPSGADCAAPAAASLVARTLGSLARGEAEMAALAAELLSRYEEITLLYDLSEVLGSALDEGALCAVAVERCLRAIPASSGTISLLDADGRLEPVAARGAPGAKDVWAGTEGVAAQVTATGNEALMHEGEGWAGPDGASHAGAPALLSVPVVPSVKAGGGSPAIGALTLVGRRSGERFSAGDARLASSVAFQLGVAVENSRLMNNLRAAELVQHEIDIAASIQRGLLPGAPPDVPGIALAGLCVPAARVGGDYYDFLIDGSGRVSLIIADVAGHSIGSALMMAMARAVLRREMSAGKSPAQVLGATNDAMLDDLTTAGLFITAFCARYDGATGELSFASGGHNRPLLRPAGGAGITNLDADGMPIGVMGGVFYEEVRVSMSPGDLVLLYTDGVVEARDATGEQFGDARLSQLVADIGGGGPGALVDGTYAAVQRHLAGTVPQDDLTALALQVRAA